MPRALRSVLPLVMLAALSLALVACDGGDDEENGDASPIVPTATITLTALPEPTQTPSEDAGGESSEGDVRTGDPALDAIIEAVESRDLVAIAGLMDYQDVACTQAPGAGGPPKCEPGMTEGDLLRGMFPVSMCEAGWTAHALTTLAPALLAERGVYSLSQPGGRATEFVFDNWPPADALLLFHMEPDSAEQGLFRLNILDGRIVSATFPCGVAGPRGDLNVVGNQAAEVTRLREEPNEAETTTPPTTGVESVDEVLEAVATYDWPALREGALEAMQSLPPVECSEPPLEGPGGVACDTAKGETAGTPVSVFPVAYCEGDLVRDPGDVLRSVLDQVPTVHAVVELPSKPPQSELYPNGAYWLVYDLQGRDGGPDHVRLHVTEEGNVTVVWFGCAPPIEGLLLLEGQPLPEIEVSDTLE